jgi:RNA recognition motif-containing protein
MAQENTMYVGNLSWDTSDESLAAHFGSDVVSAAVQRHEDTGRSKGWGLVTMGSPEGVSNACANLHNTELDGRTIIVREDRGATNPEDRKPRKPRQKKKKKKKERRSVDLDNISPSASLYIGNLSWEVTTEMLEEKFRNYATESVEVVFGNNKRSRGYGLVRCTSQEEAAQAISDLHETEYEGRNMYVRYEASSASE